MTAATTDNNVTRGTGRRKSAIARVRLFAGTGKFTINGLDGNDYFVTHSERRSIVRPFEVAELVGKYDVIAKVHGGGKQAQAEAVLLGISRSLLKLNEELSHQLKEERLLTRDPRMKERKKPGQPGARRRFQFSKR